ncbi:FAD-binding oxidoreductase [Millisia brevis]|uniref:FAD-binding oxidoreductase n=1 Tax=Millisia brevis TaxID=264148 RepID=UPI0008365944|nr:FAD-binding oxidoreductase [Millisia brevis]
MVADIGIALRADADGVADAADLANAAERAGLSLVVLLPAVDAPDADVWTMASWVAARTATISIGIDPHPPTVDGLAGMPFRRVVARAVESLEALVPGRLITDPDRWTVTDHLDAAAARSADASERAIVVPVTSIDEIDALAATARTTGITGGPSADRPLAARLRRAAGIDYDGVPGSLRASAIEPGDPAFPTVSSTYMRGGRPGLVLRPRTVAEVGDALAFAARHPHLPFGLRSAGHGISGRSTNRDGLILDMGGWNQIEMLDAERGLVRVGPGATWKQVSRALEPYGRAIGSGDYGGVGVGGLATAGGVGFLSRSQGLTLDMITAVELVLPDGTPVRATAEDHPDLFWAMRGAGANFGVATAFEFTAPRLGSVGWAQLAVVVDDLGDALAQYLHVQNDSPRDTVIFALTGRPRPGEPTVLQFYGMVADDDPGTILERLTPFARIGTLVQQQVVLTPYADVLATAPDPGPGGHRSNREVRSRSGLLSANRSDEFDDFARAAADFIAGGATYFFQFRAMGGAIGDTPADATAFAHRDAAFSVAALGANDQRLDRGWAPLRGYMDGTYLSFETDRSPERLVDAFGARGLARLTALKRHYDPGNLLSDNFALGPAVAATHEEELR